MHISLLYDADIIFKLRFSKFLIFSTTLYITQPSENKNIQTKALK